MSNIDKLNQMAEGRKSSWLDEAINRELNSTWMKYSVEFAFALLQEMRHQGLTQRELAEKMGVTAQYINKVVKGRENLSFETISKIEEALGTSIVHINVPVRTSIPLHRTVSVRASIKETSCNFKSSSAYCKTQLWAGEGAA